MTRDEPSTLPSAVEPADGVPRMVPGHKWIRALVDGQVVVDARAFTFVWEIPIGRRGSSVQKTSTANCEKPTGPRASVFGVMTHMFRSVRLPAGRGCTGSRRGGGRAPKGAP